MRGRAFIHVDGSKGSGKTTFIERLLELGLAATCIRCLRADESPRPDELERYSGGGASSTGTYRLLANFSADVPLGTGGLEGHLARLEASQNPDFWEIDVLQEYSQVVLIEGPKPTAGLDLTVFVALPSSAAVFTRIQRDCTAEHQAQLKVMEDAATTDEGAARFLAHLLPPQAVEAARSRPLILQDLRKSLASQLEDLRHLKPPPPTTHWALTPHFQGLQRAHLVVVNIGSEEQRPLAERILQEVPRLRRDPEIFQDVMDLRTTKLPITAVIANLANPKDGGLKKALARVKKAWTQASRG